MGEDGTGGRLVAGSENGTLTVYNPEVIMSSGAEAVIGQSDKHTGPIRALDFNPFQVNICGQMCLCHYRQSIQKGFFVLVLKNKPLILLNFPLTE